MAQLRIKITKNGIAFSLEAVGKLSWKDYSVNHAMSIEANLRQAFRETDVLSRSYDAVEVLLDSPVILLPLDDFLPEEAETQYRFMHPDLPKTSVVETCVLPQEHDVALFAVTKDLKTILTDNFEHFTLLPLMYHHWERMLQHSLTGHNKRVYCYFHDKKMEVCSFKRNHFLFQNSFDIEDWHDALFFILGIWQNLGCQSTQDDLLLLGDIPAREAFINETKGYIKRVTTLTPNP